MGNQILTMLAEEHINSGENEMQTGLRYRAIADTCSRYNIIPQFVHEATDADPLVLWSVTRNWFEKTYEIRKNSRLIIKGNPAVYSRYNVSIVGENTADEAEQILSYFRAAGRTKIALFAPNIAHFESESYVRTFLQKAALCGLPMQEHAVFWNYARLQDSFEQFEKVWQDYDAVLCYNTQAAVYLCARAKEAGVSVPGDLFVVGRGDLSLARAAQPSITTVACSETEVGQQIVKLFRYLNSNPYVKSVTVLLHSRIIPRESTAFFSPPPKPAEAEDASYLSNKLIGEETYLELGRLETMLSACSDMDIRLLQGMRRGISREALAEQEFVALGTVRYRLKRMLQHAGAENRKALFALLDKYHIDVENLKNQNESS